MSRRCFGTFGTRRECFNCEASKNCISSKLSRGKEHNGTQKENTEASKEK